MKLLDLTPKERRDLAQKIGCNSNYLEQCAHGWPDSKTGRPRQLGAEFCKKAVIADSRLTLPELRPDIWEEKEAA